MVLFYRAEGRAEVWEAGKLVDELHQRNQLPGTVGADFFNTACPE